MLLIIELLLSLEHSRLSLPMQFKNKLRLKIYTEHL